MKKLNIDRNSPGNDDKHYSGRYQPIDFIENWKLGFVAGNVVKYISRHRIKNGREDVAKASWYIGVLRQQHEDGLFECVEEGTISFKEYAEAQGFKQESMEYSALLALLNAKVNGAEVWLELAEAAVSALLKKYDNTGDAYDDDFSGDGEPVDVARTMLEDILYHRNPSPWGKAPPTRYHLNDERIGKTVSFCMGGRVGEFTVNTYADGSPGEVFIDGFGREGDEIHGWADCWAIAVSMLLQFGVDPRKIYDKFKHQQFEPDGITEVKSVPIAHSVIDLIAKWMEKSLEPTAVKAYAPDDDYAGAIELAVEGSK